MCPKILNTVGIMLFFLVGISSCYEKASVEKSNENMKSSDERVIMIVFDLHGDDIGSPEHKAMMSAIISKIKDQNAGEIMSSGFGRGNMEIVVKLQGEESREKIKRIINADYPDAKYRFINR